MGKAYTGKMNVEGAVHIPVGIKYDKEKRRLAEMIVDFAPEIEELCKVWEFGANKYSKSNWKLVENGYDRYSNALIRHLIAEDKDYYDDESKLLHAAHIAFNALARMHFILQGKVEPKYSKDKETCISSIPIAKQSSETII